MKKLSLLIALVVGLLQSCQTLRTLKSTTYIEPQKSFVLGEGRHGSYAAEVENAGEDDIEVLQLNSEGFVTSLGTLKAGQKNTYQVAGNTTVKFKNSSSEKKGTIRIIAKGDTNLSMGYKDNN